MAVCRIQGDMLLCGDLVVPDIWFMSSEHPQHRLRSPDFHVDCSFVLHARPSSAPVLSLLPPSLLFPLDEEVKTCWLARDTCECGMEEVGDGKK